MRGDWNFTQLLEEGSSINNKFMMVSPQHEMHTQRSPPEVKIDFVVKMFINFLDFVIEEYVYYFLVHLDSVITLICDWSFLCLVLKKKKKNLLDFASFIN